MLLADTLLSMTISLGAMAAAFAAWSDVRATRQTVEALEQLHTQQRELQRLLERLSLSAGATVLAQNTAGAVRWQLKPAPLSGTEGTRDDTLTWWTPRDIDPRDCQGNQASTLDLIAHQFKLGSKQELTCKDSQRAGTLFQALAERVEDLQALYAEAAPASGSDPALAALQWKTAAQVHDWQQVRAVQLCLRWASASKLLQGQAATTGCQNETVAADGRLRRLQRMTLRLASQGDG
jgi:hypothetical protein